MGQVSEVGLEEEEIELDLGLSIGGSFSKPEKRISDPKFTGFDSDPREDPHHNNQNQAWQVTKDAERECMVAGMGVDQHAKRKIHAFRRQEAKKKREEKQQRKWVREAEPQDQRVSKRGKTDQGTVVGSTASFTATQGQHLQPYAPVQYVPFSNGFVLPCAVPFWTPIPSEKNVCQSPAPPCRGFRPFSANGCEGEHNGERDGVNGSSMCSSSVVSEHGSPSHEGGGSTDSHSHSAHSLAEPTQLNSSDKENNIRNPPEQGASSYLVISENVRESNHIVKEILPKITQFEQTKLKEEATINNKSTPIDKPLSNENSSNNGPMKETKTNMGKLPKPVSQTSSLPQMPYVSTTGNGPNGKTVNGFLYRYTKSEVSIVCVCHGSTFSPAEFVQHAGGTDISHPLRHITVIPFAFG